MHHVQCAVLTHRFVDSQSPGRHCYAIKFTIRNRLYDVIDVNTITSRRKKKAPMVLRYQNER